MVERRRLDALPLASASDFFNNCLLVRRLAARDSPGSRSRQSAGSVSGGCWAVGGDFGLLSLPPQKSKYSAAPVSCLPQSSSVGSRSSPRIMFSGPARGLPSRLPTTSMAHRHLSRLRMSIAFFGGGEFSYCPTSAISVALGVQVAGVIRTRSIIEAISRPKGCGGHLFFCIPFRLWRIGCRVVRAWVSSVAGSASGMYYSEIVL